MKCYKCGKEITDDSQFCEYCGNSIDKQKREKVKKVIIVIVITIIIITMIIGGFIYYISYTKECSRREKALSRIGSTLDQLADFYKCPTSELTADRLEQIAQEHENYLKEQEAYKNEYGKQVLEIKQHCIDKIKNIIIGAHFKGTKNDNYITISPKYIQSVDFYFISVNPEKKELTKIYMALTYTGEGIAVSPSTNKCDFFEAGGLVKASLNIERDKFESFIIMGMKNSMPGVYGISEGEDIDLGVYTNYPYIMWTKNGKDIYINMDKEPFKDTSSDIEISKDYEESNNNNTNTDNENNNVKPDKIFTNREAMLKSEGVGTSYNDYAFYSDYVEYSEEGVTYKGVYTLKDNKILITYNEAFEISTPIALDKSNEELTIIDENTLVNQDGVKYLRDNEEEMKRLN